MHSCVALFGRPVKDMLAPGGKGCPLSSGFEQQVRCLLASGCSARAAREQLLQTSRMFLRPDAARAYADLVPNLRWFQGQREALGNEAWLYSMVELTRANECLQHGFDETSIDGTPTLNQWILLHAGPDMPPRLVTIQCAGLLVGSTAAEIASYNLVGPINLYCIETLILDANILRDSILTRIEQIRFLILSLK